MTTSDKNTISLSEFYEENLYRLQDGVSEYCEKLRHTFVSDRWNRA